MQTATTRRHAHAPLAATIVVAAGLVAGVAAFGVTDNLPWQSDSAATVQQSTGGAGVNPLIKGGRPAGQGDGLIGPNTGTVSRAPMIKGAPSYGQGEGIIGPGAVEIPASGIPNAQDRADSLTREVHPPLLQVRPGDDEIGFTEGEGQVGPGGTSHPSENDGYRTDPFNGGYTER